MGDSNRTGAPRRAGADPQPSVRRVPGTPPPTGVSDGAHLRAYEKRMGRDMAERPSDGKPRPRVLGRSFACSCICATWAGRGVSAGTGIRSWARQSVGVPRLVAGGLAVSDLA